MMQRCRVRLLVGGYPITTLRKSYDTARLQLIAAWPTHGTSVDATHQFCQRHPCIYFLLYIYLGSGGPKTRNIHLPLVGSPVAVSSFASVMQYYQYDTIVMLQVVDRPNELFDRSRKAKKNVIIRFVVDASSFSRPRPADFPVD